MLREREKTQKKCLTQCWCSCEGILLVETRICNPIDTTQEARERKEKKKNKTESHLLTLIDTYFYTVRGDEGTSQVQLNIHNQQNVTDHPSNGNRKQLQRVTLHIYKTITGGIHSTMAIWFLTTRDDEEKNNSKIYTHTHISQVECLSVTCSFALSLFSFMFLLSPEMLTSCPPYSHHLQMLSQRGKRTKKYDSW